MIHSLRGILQIQFLEDRYSTGNPAFLADLSNNLLKSRAYDVDFFSKPIMKVAAMKNL